MARFGRRPKCSFRVRLLKNETVNGMGLQAGVTIFNPYLKTTRLTIQYRVVKVCAVKTDCKPESCQVIHLRKPDTLWEIAATAVAALVVLYQSSSTFRASNQLDIPASIRTQMLCEFSRQLSGSM